MKALDTVGLTNQVFNFEKEHVVGTVDDVRDFPDYEPLGMSTVIHATAGHKPIRDRGGVEVFHGYDRSDGVDPSASPPVKSGVSKSTSGIGGVGSPAIGSLLSPTVSKFR